MRSWRRRLVGPATAASRRAPQSVLFLLAAAGLAASSLANAAETHRADALSRADRDAPVVRLPPVACGAAAQTDAQVQRTAYVELNMARPAGDDGHQPPDAPLRFVQEANGRQVEEVAPAVGADGLPLDLIPTPAEALPIDLATALRLAGASNLQIALARASVGEAQAVLSLANVLWVPSLQAGVGYNRHDGQIQDTRGDIIEVSRSSLFTGGGAVTDGAFPLTGAAAGPARFAVDLPLADALFEPLAARRVVGAERANVQAMFNDALVDAAAAYLALGEAYVQLGIAQQAIEHARELARITEEFAEAGRGLQADADRVRADLNDRRREFFVARERVGVISAELVRQLRLDPTVILLPLEAPVGPLELVDTHQPLGALISQAIATRPELRRQRAVVDETFARARQEQWRPLLPNLHAGASGGGFGGGRNSFFGDYGGRVDFDALAIWELRNLGFGTRALRAQALSRNDQARVLLAQTRDLVAAEVASAVREVDARRGQIETSLDQLEAASQALPLNFEGILGGVLRPIEAQQAIDALATAQASYTAALVGYNQSQFALLRAIGVPPGPQAIAAPELPPGDVAPAGR